MGPEVSIDDSIMISAWPISSTTSTGSWSFFNQFSIVLLLATFAHAAVPTIDDWRSRSIYQVLTDRFAVSLYHYVKYQCEHQRAVARKRIGSKSLLMTFNSELTDQHQRHVFSRSSNIAVGHGKGSSINWITYMVWDLQL